MTSLPLLDTPAALEALSRVEVVYTDLDGTLLAPGGNALADAQGQPSFALAEAIVGLNTAGLTVVPISGREVDQLFELTRLLGWSDFIAEAGAVAVHGSRPNATVTFNRGIWPAELVGPAQPTPFERITASGAYDALVDAFPARIEYYTEGRVRQATHLLRGCIDAAEAQIVLDAIEPPIDIVDNGALRWRGTLECEDATPHAYHLVARGVSKSGAIAADLAHRGLEPSQAAAIGDSATDIEMADQVSLMVLVANALESAGVNAELARNRRGNVVATTRERSDGWVEFARTWLAARKHMSRHTHL